MKVYADTSVYGGVFNRGFEDDSAAFFDGVREGRYALVVSAVVQREIAHERTPARVQNLYYEMEELAEHAKLTLATEALRDAYLARGVVARKSAADAAHVALATLSGCDAIVAWDYKHIVNRDKIPLYNAVNIQQGYDAIRFFTPKELTMTMQ